MAKGQVLLVDDDPGQLRIREMILRNAGFIVHIATNAESVARNWKEDWRSNHGSFSAWAYWGRNGS
jgi:DNA-binding NtrC family response regulator